MTNEKCIFFVCYGGGHINIIEPVVDGLLRKGYKVKLLALTTAYKQVEKKYNNQILKKISDYLFLFDSRVDEIFKNGLLIFEENFNSSSGLSKLEVLTYLGISLTDEIDKYGYEEAMHTYKKHGRQSFLPIETLTKIIDYEKPNILISTTSPRFEKASFIAAKKIKIKSIQILDLFDDYINFPNATYTVVMNDYVKERLLKKGFNEEEILVYGQPAIEKSIKEILKIRKEDVLKTYRIDENKKNLVYFSQPPIKYDDKGKNLGFISYEYINPYIFEILNKVEYKYNVFFRIHPNENLEDYKEYFKTYTNIIYTNNNLNLQQCIALSDVVVTPYSTVSIEAISCNKVVFTFKPNFSEYFPVNFMKKKPFIYSDSFEDLYLNLVKKDKKSETSNFLNLNFVEKIINFINE